MPVNSFDERNDLNVRPVHLASFQRQSRQSPHSFRTVLTANQQG
jgi:hypothetical protein